MGYRSLSAVNTDDLGRLVNTYNRQAPRRKSPDQPWVIANFDEDVTHEVMKRSWPTHKLILHGLNIDEAREAVEIPGIKCGTMAWLRIGEDIQRPSNSKVFVIGTNAYFVCTWTDIFGHSKHGKQSDMRFQTQNNMYYYVGKLSNLDAKAVITELTERINVDRS